VEGVVCSCRALVYNNCKVYQTVIFKTIARVWSINVDTLEKGKKALTFRKNRNENGTSDPVQDYIPYDTVSVI